MRVLILPKTLLIVLFSLCVTLTTWSPKASADELGVDCPPDKGKPLKRCVPVMDNFTAFELVSTGVVGVSGALVGVFGQDVFGPPTPSLGPPTEGSLDWDISKSWNSNFAQNSDKEMLGGLVTRLGHPIIPLAAGLYYGAGAMDTWFGNNSFMPDLRHEFLALSGAFAWTMFVTHSAKFAIGRERPFSVVYGLEPSDVGMQDRETPLSFPSGHTAAVAAMMSFMYLDISDQLVHETLADSGPWTKFLVGRALPFSVAYGLIGLTFYERVWSQEHWFSDNVMGAAIGLTFGHLFYLAHFDSEGNPRQDQKAKSSLVNVSNFNFSPATMRDEDGSASMGIGLGFQWN